MIMATFRSEVDPEMQLQLHGCGGNVQITGQDGTVIEISGAQEFERYIQPNGSTLAIHGYPSDVQITLPRRASVELHGIGNNVEVRGVAEVGAQSLAKLEAHGVGGSVRAAQVTEIALDSIGGDAKIEAGSQSVALGRIGGNVLVSQADRVSLRTAGGDAVFQEVGQVLRIGQIGGNLQISWRNAEHLLGEGKVSGWIGGSAELSLPEGAALTLSAILGGGMQGSGNEWNLRSGPGRRQLIFGEGGGQLSLIVGGQLNVRGGPQPQQQEGFGGFPWGADWDDFRGTMDGFGQEMRGLGRDIARDVRVAGREARRGVQEDFGPRGARGPRGPRMHMRFNDHEFNFDPEQIERIKREARAAAASGIARAQEAVEQALQQWQQGGRPQRPGAPPRPPAPPRPRGPESSYTGQTVRIDREPDTAAPSAPAADAAPPQARNLDEERLAILRMVHEGRLAPDEAEMLLRGLEDRS
jgi:hypothetical protein